MFYIQGLVSQLNNKSNIFSKNIHFTIIPNIFAWGLCQHFQIQVLPLSETESAKDQLSIFLYILCNMILILMSEYGKVWL